MAAAASLPALVAGVVVVVSVIALLAIVLLAFLVCKERSGKLPSDLLITPCPICYIR